MTYFGRHDRTVVQGADCCTCGNEWPCPRSAEGRWAALKDYLCESARGFDAEEYRAALVRYMDELEAQR